MYVLETIGSGEMLWTLFNAIASLLRPGGGSLMQSFIMMGTAIGSVAAIGYTVFRNELRPFLSWFISSQVIIVGLLSPVSTVMIRDVLTGNVRTVDNVPFALAFTASTLSSLGTGITRAIEVVFQAAPSYVGGRGFYSGGVRPQAFDQLAYTQTGFMFASHVMAQMKGVQLANDDLAENLKEFVNQCVVYDALIGTNYTMHDLKRSDDIWGLVSRTASQLRGFAWREVERAPDGTFVNSAGTTIVTCRVGVQRFNRMWTEANESLITKFQDKLCEQFGIRQDSTRSLSHSIASNLPGALNKLTHSARNASQHLQQQIMISSLLTSNDRKSVELGGSPNFEVRRAYLQQRDTYQTIGQTIAQTLPSLKNVLEALVYALFIFVVLLAMFPGGWGVLTFYTKILLWLQLWPPLFSILNFIMTESLSSSAAGAMGTAQGITIANMVGLSNIAQDMAATAGYLSSMIPILSWALIERGGYAFVSMASGILGVSQQAASSAAIEKSTGNYSFGIVSLEGVQAYNSSMLKHDASASYTGGHFSSNEGITARNFTADGETILNQAESHLPVTVSAQSSREEVLQEALTKADSLQHSYSEAASNKKQEAQVNYLKLGEQASSMRASNVKFENNEAGSVMHEAANNYDKLQQIGEKYGITKEAMNSHMVSYSAGGGTPKILPIQLGAEYRTADNAQAVAQNATDELTQFVKGESFRDSMSHMNQASKSQSFDKSNQNIKELVRDTSTSLEESKSYESQSNKAREVSDSFRNEQSQNRTQGIRVDTALNQEWVNAVGADKITDMSTREKQYSANQFARENVSQYREDLFKKLDSVEIKKDLDAGYSHQALAHSNKDVSNAYEVRRDQIQRDSFQGGFISRVDDSVQYSAEKMIAFNTANLSARGGATQSKVAKGGEHFMEEFKKTATKNLTPVQSVVAINQLEKRHERNKDD
jgi:conjugal transfer mating pair stabilization protein TraG